jgi:hypothetical protein
MNFIRRIGRDEIYIKYVHQLVNVMYTPLLTLCTTKYLIDAPAVSELR